MATAAQTISAILNDVAVVNSYNPEQNWAATAQPVPGLDTNSYRALADATRDTYRERLCRTLKDNQLSYALVSHEDFQTYEKGTPSFDQWLRSVAKERKFNPRVDVVVVMPCVKPAASGDWKSEKDQTAEDRTRDYLRAMLIRRKCGRSDTKHVQDTADLITILEQSVGKIAHKNQYYKPHETGYRGHKSIESEKIPTERMPEFIKLPKFVSRNEATILSETKVESEGEMEIHRLTRHLLELSRALEQRFKGFYKQFGEKSGNFTTEEKAESRIIGMIGAVSTMMYDYFYHQSGYNLLLGPNAKAAHAQAQDPHVLVAQIKQLPLPARKLIIKDVQGSEELCRIFPKIAAMSIHGNNVASYGHAYARQHQ